MVDEPSPCSLNVAVFHNTFSLTPCVNVLKSMAIAIPFLYGNCALDADSDNDVLFDGTELGNGCADPATNPASESCTPDADGGATTTDPLDADTDNGGVSDGGEDTNGNGRVDPGEADPLNGTDDYLGQVCGNGIQTPNETCDDGNTNDDDGCDSNCTPTSCGNGIQSTGEACDDNNSLDGDGCSASCLLEMEGSTGGGDSPSSSSGTGGSVIGEPEGCDCSIPGKTSTSNSYWIALLITVGVCRRLRAGRRASHAFHAQKTDDATTDTHRYP